MLINARFYKAINSLYHICLKMSICIGCHVVHKNSAPILGRLCRGRVGLRVILRDDSDPIRDYSSGCCCEVLNSHEAKRRARNRPIH